MRTAALYEMLFGLITMVGGVIGYVTADSWISLLAGLISGLVLIFAALRMQKGFRSGLWASMIVSLLLLGQFGRSWLLEGEGASGDFFPAGLMTIMAAISLLILLLVLVQPNERKRDF